MKWERPRWMSRVRRLPEHLHKLAGRLHELADQVRDAVSELVGDTVGNAVRDVIQRAWRPKPALSSAGNIPCREYELDEEERAYREYYAQEYGEDFEHEQSCDASTADSANPSSANPSVAKSALLALGIQTAGWWLRQRGSWLGALGLGCIVGGLTVLGGPIAIAGVNLLEAASDIYSINQMLNVAPDTLMRT